MEHRGDELTSSGCPLGRNLFPASFPSTRWGSVGLFPAPSLQHEGSSARIWGQSRGGQLQGIPDTQGHVGTVAWGRFPQLLAPSPPLLLGTPRRSTGCCSSVFPPVKWAQQAPFPSRGGARLPVLLCHVLRDPRAQGRVLPRAVGCPGHA